MYYASQRKTAICGLKLLASTLNGEQDVRKRRIPAAHVVALLVRHTDYEPVSSSFHDPPVIAMVTIKGRDLSSEEVSKGQASIVAIPGQPLSQPNSICDDKDHQRLLRDREKFPIVNDPRFHGAIDHIAVGIESDRPSNSREIMAPAESLSDGIPICAA